MKKFIKKYGYLIWNFSWGSIFVFVAFSLGGFIRDNFSVLEECSFDFAVGVVSVVFFFCFFGSIFYIGSLFQNIKSLLDEFCKSSGSPDDK